MKRKIIKKILRSGIILTLTLLNTILTINVSGTTNLTLNEVLKQYNVQFGIKGSLIVIRNFKYPAREKTFHTIIAQDEKTRIELEIIKPMLKEQALNYSDSKYKIIKNLYGPQIIPYSGTLTTTTECPDDKKPKEATIEVMNRLTKVLLANATDRYVLGVWEDDLIKTKATFAMVYDKENKTIYQIIIFQPYKSFNQNEVLDILKSLKNIPES